MILYNIINTPHYRGCPITWNHVISAIWFGQSKQITWLGPGPESHGWAKRRKQNSWPVNFIVFGCQNMVFPLFCFMFFNVFDVFTKKKKQEHHQAVKKSKKKNLPQDEKRWSGQSPKSHAWKWPKMNRTQQSRNK